MSVSESVDFTLVLPLYNEGQVLRRNLHRIYQTLHGASFSFELILIDDGSRDETIRIGQDFAATHKQTIFIAHEHNMGRGATVMDGFRRANGAVLGYMDVDCEVSPVYLLEFARDLLDGVCDGITGLRIYKLSFGRIIRSILSIGYRVLCRMLIGIAYRDTETGYKLFTKSAFNKIAANCMHAGWFWDTEIMALAQYAHLTIQERPVLFLHDLTKKSSVRVAHDVVAYLRALVSFKKRSQSLKRTLA